MGNLIPAGTQVEIKWVALTPDQRATTLPSDTGSTPYIVRARGILMTDSRIGNTVTIKTQAGRHLEGELEVAGPADTHTFGRPPDALVRSSDAIQELRGQVDAGP